MSKKKRDEAIKAGNEYVENTRKFLKELEGSIDAVESFQKQRNTIEGAIGFTFTVAAWEEVKRTTTNAENIEYFRLMGLPCYVVPSQTQDCIAWYSSEALDLFLSESTKLEQELNRQNANNN
jgi:hypothetical protein